MGRKVKVVAVLTARPGQAEALRTLLGDMVAPSRAEPGNLCYDLWADRTELGRFFLDELYADEAAASAHHESGHFQTYLARVDELAERTALNLEAIEVA